MDYNRDNLYYSQNNTSSGQAPEKMNPFSIASMVCGILSILLCCTGILSIPLGALGILFAILTRRIGKSMPSASIAGIALSCAGVLFGLAMGAYVIYLIATDPEYRDIYEDTYEYYYNEFYEYNLEHLNDSAD